MKLDTWVFHPIFGPGQLWFRRPDGTIVLGLPTGGQMDCLLSDIVLIHPRHETASLKQLDYVRDVYGETGCVLYVDETGGNPPLVTVQYPVGLRVRSWVEIAAQVEGPF